MVSYRAGTVGIRKSCQYCSIFHVIHTTVTQVFTDSAYSNDDNDNDIKVQQ